MNDYRKFLSAKQLTAQPSGFEVAEADINPRLFDWQRKIVAWALRLGKAAMFEECGLGKTAQQLEWARHVAAHTGRPVLVLAPLAVAHQTVAEATKFGIDAVYCRSGAEARMHSKPVTVANYKMLKAFDPADFAGVVLDESSILKAYSGKTRKQIEAAFERTPYKLCCTATPAPNDHLELGNHAEFLDILRGTEMLARWFVNDSMQAGHYRIKGHAEADFWRWVATWAVCMGAPSDLGYSDDGFVLPELRMHDVSVAVDHTRAHEYGRLFLDGSLSATAIWKEKAVTAADRCARAVEIVHGDEHAPWVVWCDTNDESGRLKKLLPEAVEVRGSDTPERKEDKLNSFTDGRKRVIITKPDIAGFGLNWQHCPNMAFVGVTYSFEKLYQALRRAWRFGQTRPVNAYLVYAESEGNVLQTIRAKQAAHAEMQVKMNVATRAHGALGLADHREGAAYAPRVRMHLPAYLQPHKYGEIFE